jgi:hypothetical protein
MGNRCYCLPHLVLAASFALIFVLMFNTFPVGLSNSSGDYCLADGRTNPKSLNGFDTVSENPLSFSYFFTINMGFGSYSFSTAKFIDVTWDVLVGRGGQLFLIFITYRVFAKSLLYSMERYPVSYKLFAAVAFDTASWSTMGRMCRDGFGRGFGAKIRLIGMLLTSAYVIAFPTLMSAMTGYTTLWIPYIAHTNGTLVELARFDRIDYFIVDAARIGLSNNTVVYDINFVDEFPAGYDSKLLFALEQCKRITQRTIALSSASDCQAIDMLDFCGDGCPTGSGHAEDSDFRANGTSSFTLRGRTYGLDAPTLNITKVPEDLSRGYYRALWAYLGLTPYSTDDMARNLVCYPATEYQWGFSYLLLFIVSILNFIWVFIMFCLWRNAEHRSRLCKTGRKLGTFRAAMDLSSAIRAELGPDAETYSNNVLNKQLKQSSKGVSFVEGSLQVSVESKA